MRHLSKPVLAGAVALSLLAGGTVVAQGQLTQNPAEVRAGTYKLDSEHGKITYKLNHLGFSTYIGQFANIDATLTLDPANPTASTLTATVPVSGHDNTSEGLKGHLQTADFFDAAQFPAITFVATSIDIDDDNPSEADVTGNLTIKDVTRPVTLDVEFNQAGEMRGQYRVGFDGEVTIKRSEFGMTYGLPAIGDDVELHIEGEFVAQ